RSIFGRLVLKVREASEGQLIVSKKYLEQSQTIAVQFHDPRPSIPDYWLYQGRLYRATVDLSADDFHALLAEKELRERKRLERARAAAASANRSAPTSRRKAIPTDVQTAVW